MLSHQLEFVLRAEGCEDNLSRVPLAGKVLIIKHSAEQQRLLLQQPKMSEGDLQKLLVNYHVIATLAHANFLRSLLVRQPSQQ